MRECWINAYHYAPNNLTFIAFKNELEAIFYVPSNDLKLAYRIHVRLK